MENINFPALRSFLLTLIELTFLPSKRTDLIFEARRMREMLSDMIFKLTPQPTQQELDKRIEAFRGVAKNSSHYSADGNLVLKITEVTQTGIKVRANQQSTEQTIDYKDMDIATTKFYRTNMVEVTLREEPTELKSESQPVTHVHTFDDGQPTIDLMRGLAEMSPTIVSAASTEIPAAVAQLADGKLVATDKMMTLMSDSKMISLTTKPDQAKMVDVSRLVVAVGESLSNLALSFGLRIRLLDDDVLSDSKLTSAIENAIPSPLSVYRNLDASEIRDSLVRLFLVSSPFVRAALASDSKLNFVKYSDAVNKTLAELATLRKALIVELNRSTKA